MRNGATFRIVMWASAGFLVSAGWGFYFATADKANPIPWIVDVLSGLSVPIAGAVTLLYPALPVGLWPLVVANIATYTLLGFIVETIRQRYRPLKIS